MRDTNRGQPANSPSITLKFNRPHIGVNVKCDVHPWMEAWFIGTKSPWAGVSSADGTVALRKIPTEEEISIHLWHPTLGSAHLKTRLAPHAVTLKKLTQKDFRKR